LANVDHIAVFEFVGEFHDTYKELACNVSLTIRFLLSHSDFSRNLRLANNEHNSIALRRLCEGNKVKRRWKPSRQMLVDLDGYET